MKKKMWKIVIGIVVFYFFIYLPFSLFWSAIDTGDGYKRSVTLLETVEKDLELHKIFARHGMKLTGDGASWRSKTCGLRFVVEDGTNARIPPEVEEYLLNNPDLVKGCRIEVQIKIPPESKEEPTGFVAKKYIFHGDFSIRQMRNYVPYFYGNRPFWFIFF